MNEENKIYLEADIKLEEPTEELREAASAVINLPGEKDKQPDLQYFSAVFVSSGENLNHAYFMTSELVLAEGTIVNKALDIEHKESEIIGHIYDRVFVTREGASISLKELSGLEKSNLDKKEIHIAIAGIVYKDRFPNMANEIADKQWKVSMECYYRDFDVKVGDLIISQKEAEVLGLTKTEDGVFGGLAKVIKDGVEIASGKLTRVLRGICFSGCGVVKNPANPDSIVLETANNKENVNIDKEEIVLTYDKIKQNGEKKQSNNLTSPNIDGYVSENKEEFVIEKNDTVEKCLRNEIKSITTASLEKLVVAKKQVDQRKKLLNKLVASINIANRL